MAEALLSNEPKTLKEFGTLRESSTLQDISLASISNRDEVMKNVVDKEHEADNENKIKSSSLKRFFRMPLKKKGGDDADPDHCQVESAEGDDIDKKLEKQKPKYSTGDGIQDTEDHVEESKMEHKRSKFRFGKMQSNSLEPERSQRDLSNSFSRINLRASLSSYWNTVFKQKKNKKSFSKSNKNDQDPYEADINEDSNGNEETENVVSTNENYTTVVNNLTEDVHALKISDENDNK